MGKNNNPVAAASAVYRKASNKVSQATGKEAVHSRYPKLDFEAAVDSIQASSKEKALEWYERGIKRGIAFATDRVADKTIQVEQDGTLIAPENFKVKVRTKFQGDEWKSHELVIDPEAVGFSR